MTKKDSAFHKLLVEQLIYELQSANQYLAMFVHYDQLDMPQMAKVFKNHYVEENQHALAMINYLLDADLPLEIPAVPEVKNEFTGIIEPVKTALEHEEMVSAKIYKLACTARDDYDFAGESFIKRFIDEQLEEEAYFKRLLAVVEAKGATRFEVENWVAREIDTEASIGAADEGTQAL